MKQNIQNGTYIIRIHNNNNNNNNNNNIIYKIKQKYKKLQPYIQ